MRAWFLPRVYIVSVKSRVDMAVLDPPMQRIIKGKVIERKEDEKQKALNVLR